MVTNIIPYENIVVKDLTQGDKIVLGNGDSRAYTLVTVGNLVKIKLNGKEVCGVEVGSVSESDLRTDLEKLKLNFNDPAIKYFIKKQ